MHRSRTCHYAYLKYTRHAFMLFSFHWRHNEQKSYSSLATYNSIPTCLKNCSSLYSFKRHLKSHLMAQLILLPVTWRLPAPPSHA